ncbi:MAG: hypothetical protein A2W93_12285 [Bacteroidetes bacterium GWF2_43_63]|nr:MAG: hypothetical protein A2W94_07035 [Bacteroidetes bacterium GWE2_42_42]OFY56445.1 MAG: hypothetical protein A2W93_12285 [Bacteroidetes bacterium GWF2_43_63]HBG71211.1 hypothetical protein [Bacteroidales bacterium]HCB61294.1 hypothetical protein [Bacteroidales bacterium]HCY23311.1 hypothetical protein [Bacteroidales bacterium]
MTIFYRNCLKIARDCLGLLNQIKNIPKFKSGFSKNPIWNRFRLFLEMKSFDIYVYLAFRCFLM